MRFKTYLHTFVGVSAILAHALAPGFAYAKPTKVATARTPIKHVIVIVGENRSFDQIFATYKPVNSDETVMNLLSQGIVKADGAPGANYALATQYKAISHTYADHASIVKFINFNWSLGPITARSRDNLPDPETNSNNPYVPVNGPAIGDLVDLFQF